MWQAHSNLVGSLGPAAGPGGGYMGGQGQGSELQIDTGYPVYDNFLASGGRQQPQQGAKQHGARGRPDRGNAGRRQKNYRRLWEQIKAVGRGDAIDGDGRAGMPGPELSVEELVRLVSRLPPDVPCVPHVAPSLQYLDSRAFAAFMKDLAKNGHVARAMELFDWIKDLNPVHDLAALADVYTYTTAINNAGQAQQLRRALELVGEMRTRGVQCNVHTYSALMNVCIKCDACELALDVFKEMRTDGVRPNVVTYNTLVDVYGKIGQWERAVRVLEDMSQDGLEPEVRTFNTAIIACNMCGQPQEALKVYQRLLEAGLQPISTTYTALISAYAKGGQLDRALDTFKQMVREGCERSVITYSALINACEKAGQWDLALQLFERMQQEGIAPNTVTYNSLITACTQGSQWEKASEVFDHMRYHNCRPDTVTYSALIGAYEKGGQWLRAVKAFEQMQAQNCRPDSSIYQSMVDMLWQSGVSWLQARALQLYASAARSWQFRFTVQQASPADAALVEFIVPASTASVAVLSTQRWLCDMRAQLDRDGALALAGAAPGGGRLQCERVAVSLGRGRHTREPGCGGIRRMLFAMLDGLGSPLRPMDVGSAGGAVTVEAPMAAFTQWLAAPDLPTALSALLLPAVLASGQQTAARDAGGKRGGGSGGGGGGGVDVCQSDAAIEAQCAEAFNTVAHFELTHHVDVESMSADYLQARPTYIDAAFAMAEGLNLRQETAYDALLLMDRVMATGTSLTDGLSRLFVAAALRIAALQGEASDQVPSDATLAAGSGFPPGTVAKMEVNVRAALANDTSSISCLRCLKLYLERLGQDLGEGAPLAPLHAGHYALLREAARAPALVGARPSAVAAAVLVAARGAAGAAPAWPSALARLTGLADASAPDLAAALAVVDPLARAAAATGALALAPGSIPLVGGAGQPAGGDGGSGSYGGGGQVWDAPRKRNGGGARSSGAPSRTGTPDLSALGGHRGHSTGDLAALLHGALAAGGPPPGHGVLPAGAAAALGGAGSGPLPIPPAARLGAAHLSLSASGGGSLAGSPALGAALGADAAAAAALGAALSGLGLGSGGASAAGSPTAALAAASAGLAGPLGPLGGFGHAALGHASGMGMGVPMGGIGMGIGGMGAHGPQLGHLGMHMGAGALGLGPGLELPQSRLQHMTSAHHAPLMDAHHGHGHGHGQLLGGGGGGHALAQQLNPLDPHHPHRRGPN